MNAKKRPNQWTKRNASPPNWLLHGVRSCRAGRKPGCDVFDAVGSRSGCGELNGGGSPRHGKQRSKQKDTGSPREKQKSKGNRKLHKKSLAESFQLDMFEHPDMTNPDYRMESSEATRTCSDPFTTAGWDLSRVTQKAASVLSVPCVGISIRCELAIHIGRHQKSSYQCYLHGGGEGSRHVVFSISWQWGSYMVWWSCKISNILSGMSLVCEVFERLRAQTGGI